MSDSISNGNLSRQRHRITSYRPAPQILAGKPGFLVRKGTGIIVAVMTAIIAGTAFISYPDVLEGTMKITTDPAPVQLAWNAGGRIGRLFVAEDAQVTTGEPLAELENNSGYDQIRVLGDAADETIRALDLGDYRGLSEITDRMGTTRGDAQPICNALSDAIHDFSLLQHQQVYKKRETSLQGQLGAYQEMYRIAGQEQQILSAGVQQADERYAANERLYAEKVISRQEYYEEAAKLHQKKLALEAQRRQQVEHTLSIGATGRQMDELAFERAGKEQGSVTRIREAARSLQNFVRDWKLKYLLSAPYGGRIHFTHAMSLSESTTAGTPVCVIVPERSRRVAEISLPAANAGKVHAGQELQLYTEQFPAAEFGYITAHVSTIAALPETRDGQTCYRIAASLPSSPLSLVTSFHRSLPPVAEMTGRAHILTAERTLLQRILDVLRAPVK